MALVLIVDDDPMILDLLADVVAEFGHTPLTACDGAAALVLARDRSPSLILSDVMMPRLDGYGLLRAVRALPELHDSIIILMSAAFPAGGFAQCDPAPNGYLAKPFSITLLEGILNALPAQGRAGHPSPA